MNKEIRVRFAPSPTGPLHIGGVRTALFNYLFAKKHKGAFILRIEDTDRNRFVEGAEEYIAEALQWLGLDPDEGPGIGGEHGPYHQSERTALYQEQVEELIAKGRAYYAFDTPEDLEAMREKLKEEGSSSQHYGIHTRDSMNNSLVLTEDESNRRIERGDPYVVRIKIEPDQVIRFDDRIRGRVEVDSGTLDDKVLMKSDGLPTYHLANVVDDLSMRISHVIRGEEWLPSAPVHVLLYKYLEKDEQMPEFAHLPLLLKPSGTGKLSKRDADKQGFPIFPLQWEDSSGYREDGYLPEALINFLALLGWNPGDEREIFSLNDLIQEFDLDRIGKAGIRFDIQKAQWFNQQYLKEMSAEALLPWLKEQLTTNGMNVDDSRALQVCEMMKERITFPTRILEESQFLFEPPSSYDEKVIRKKWDQVVEGVLKDFVSSLPNSDSNRDGYRELLSNALEKHDAGMGQVMPVLRVVITGKTGGPDMMEILEFLGPEEITRRINTAIEMINSELEEK